MKGEKNYLLDEYCHLSMVVPSLGYRNGEDNFTLGGGTIMTFCKLVIKRNEKVFVGWRILWVIEDLNVEGSKELVWSPNGGGNRHIQPTHQTSRWISPVFKRVRGVEPPRTRNRAPSLPEKWWNGRPNPTSWSCKFRV